MSACNITFQPSRYIDTCWHICGSNPFVHSGKEYDATMTQCSFTSSLECEVTSIYIPIGIRDAALICAISIINIVIALLGTLANSLVIMAYYRNCRLRTIQNTVFFLLAITDISVTALVQPMYVATNFTNILASPSCLFADVNAALSKLFLQLSLVTIVILSLQSYITLAYPYRWQIIITKTRFNVTIGASWLLILFITFSGFLHKTIYLYCPPCILLLAVVTVVVTWCWTCKLVGRHRKTIQTTQTPSTSQNISRRKILRSTVTALLVISSLLACYVLTLCFFFMRIFLNPWEIASTYPILWSLAVSLMYLNSLVNPFLLLWRSTPFRETVKHTLNF